VGGFFPTSFSRSFFQLISITRSAFLDRELDRELESPSHERNTILKKTYRALFEKSAHSGIFPGFLVKLLILIEFLIPF
jgi:hypothetical protein